MHQSEEKLLRLRYLNSEGREIPFDELSKYFPKEEGGFLTGARLQQRETIIFKRIKGLDYRQKGILKEHHKNIFGKLKKEDAQLSLAIPEKALKDRVIIPDTTQLFLDLGSSLPKKIPKEDTLEDIIIEIPENPNQLKLKLA